MSQHRFLSGRILIACVLLSMCGFFGGCASQKPSEADQPPVFSAIDGAITGKLVNGDGDPFDLGLSQDPSGPEKLRIELISPDSAVVASATPDGGKPQFKFSHVKPGTYELSVYRSVPGQRNIAGSEPVTVDAGRITPVKLTLQVTNAGDEAPAK